ncbi:hypothetical protein [Paraburkholderia sp. PGU19]|uniref:hypothetical protein n=1 Tax=Paraburkholderia sp. PGU19 TaxID=2735434 RepID=UPI0015DB22A1|nr:hypothetical protein [Paraburkholderia sp. PGU19]
MNLSQATFVAFMCAALIACSRHDALFSLAPTYTGKTVQAVSEVTGCIAGRWHASARHVRQGRVGDVIQLKAQSLFDGASIGVRIRRNASDTIVEYFQRRLAAPIYRSMVRECVRNEMAGAS